MSTMDDKPRASIDDLGRKTDELREDAMDVAGSIDDIARDATAILAQQAHENPYRTVLIAAGVGYVLGGGVPRWAIRMGVSLGARMAMSAALAELVTNDD